MYTRTNILLRRFKHCSVRVKIILFKTYCMCMYGIALWKNYTAQVMNRRVSCYYKCLKIFFGYPKFSSVANMLFELKLPTFNTLLHNYRIGFLMQCKKCNNSLVNRIIQVLWPCFVVHFVPLIVFCAHILWFSLVFFSFLNIFITCY